MFSTTRVTIGWITLRGNSYGDTLALSESVYLASDPIASGFLARGRTSISPTTDWRERDRVIILGLTERRSDGIRKIRTYGI